MTDNKKYIVNVGDQSEIWDSNMYAQKGDSLFANYKDANVFELEDVDAFDEDPTDKQYLVGVDGQQEVWDADMVTEKGSRLMEVYPDATIQRVSYKDYWGEQAKANRERRAELAQPDMERNARLAELGYYDDLTGEAFTYTQSEEGVPQYGPSIGLKPLSSAMTQSPVTGETAYYDPKVQEFFAQDTYADRQAEIARLDAEYETNPSVIAEQEWKAQVAKEQAEYRNNLRASINTFIDEEVDLGKAGIGYAGTRMTTKYGMSPYVPTGEEQAELEKREKATTALKLLEKADILSNVKEEGFWKATGNTLYEKALDTVTQDDVQAYNQIGDILSNLSKQLKQEGLNLEAENLTEEVFDKYLSTEDKNLILAFFEYNSAAEQAGRDMSKAYKGGKMFAESIPYMLEFLATGGFYKAAGQAATKGLAGALSKWVLKATKGTIGRTIRKGAAVMARDAVYALTGTAARTLVSQNTYTRMAEKSIEIGKDGELHRAKNAFVGFFDSYVENLSEVSGELIGKALGAPIRGVGMLGKTAKGAALASRLGSTSFAQWGKMLGNTKIAQAAVGAYKTIMPKMKLLGIHGYPEEIGEEYIGNAIRAITIDPNALKEMHEDGNFGAMLIGFAPMTLLGVAGGAATLAAVNVQAAKLGDHMRNMLGSHYNGEQVDHMMNRILSAENADQMQDAIDPMLNAIVEAQEAGQITSAQAENEMNMIYNYSGFVAKNKALMFAKQTRDSELAAGKRTELTQEYGKFWKEAADGSQSVQVANLNDGRTVFVVSDPAADGKISIIDIKTKERGFANVADIASEEVDGKATEMSQSWSMDAFIDTEIANERKTREQVRMEDERNAQINALSSEINRGTAINLGTETSPVMVTATGNKSKAGVEVISETGEVTTIGWEQTADALNKPIIVKTDQQIIDEETAAIVQRNAERMSRVRSNREAAQTVQQTSTEVNDAVAQEEKHIPMLPDGTVNESAFWQQDPEGYAEWNDEQNQDGGADTLEQIAAEKSELEALLKEYTKAQKTSNPSARKEAKLKSAVLMERMIRLNALEQKYGIEARKQAWENVIGSRIIHLTTQQELADVGGAEAVAASQQGARVRGFYKDGQAYMYMPGLVDASEYDEVFIHEVLGHYGLRQMLGKDFEQLLQNVWEMMSEESRQRFLNYPGVKEIADEKSKQLAAADEYIAHIAEKMSAGELMGEKVTQEEKSIWQKIVDIIKGWFAKKGIDESIMTEKYVENLIRQSYSFLAERKGENLAPIKEEGRGSALSAVEQEYETLAQDLTPEEIKEVASNEFKAAQDAYYELMANEPSVNAGEASKDFIARKKAYKELLDAAKAELDARQALINEIASREVPATTEEILEENAMDVDEERGDVRYSYRFIPDASKKELIINSIMQTTGRPRALVESWLKSETSLTSLFLENLQYLDYPVDQRYTAIKKNSDYPQGTVDFNNICRKRVNFTKMFTRLQRRYPNRVFTASELADIRSIMSKDGLVVACGLCYVEDRRQMIGEVAAFFIDQMQKGFEDYMYSASAKDVLKGKYKRGKKSADKVRKAQKYAELIGADTYVPTVYELTTQEGMDKLYNEHRGIWEAYQSFNADRGQQAQNLPQGYAEYKREVLSWTDDHVKKVNDNGGLRIFSYSDFEAHHLLDLIQIIIDCAARGVKIQGYTKVPAFARVVANTGIKLNRSLIPLGDTGIVDGQLAFDPVEGIDINDPNFLETNDNIGNILIGINDEQIRMAMADPRIHYIIPYHARQAEEILVKNNVGAWENYRDFQNERHIKDGKRVDNNINIYTEILNGGIANEREFVEKYLQICKEKAYIPKFDQFLDKDAEGNYVYTPGYYKFLVDFKLFDEAGNILPQQPVVAQFDDAFNAQIIADYIKDEQESTGEQMNKTYDKIVDALGLDESTAEGEGVRFSVRESSMDEMDSLFKEYNTDETLSALYDKVSALAHTMGLKIKFDEPWSNAVGTTVADKVKFNAIFMDSPYQPAEKKAHAILHELIHATTQYAIQAKKAGILSEEMTEAVNQLESIYNEIKADPAFEGMRGVESVHEMVAELANPKFRAALKEKNLFQQIVDAIKRLLGIETGENALDNLSSTLDYILENFDADAYRKYVDVAQRNEGYIRFSARTDEARTALFDAAKKEFGTTNNFAVAGYMLPDGTLLDFSEEGAPANMRTLDHREIEGIIMEEGKEYDNRWEYLADFMNEGAIRLLPEYAGINLMKAPTKEQRQRLFDFIYKYNGEVILEIADERLNNVAYVEYDRRTSPARIFRDIDGYFNEGIIPQQNIRFSVANESQAIFVSNAAKAVEGIKQEKATPEQWLKMIEKNGGLKAGEDKWMGLSDFLKSSDKKTLTKQEVLDFINENMIVIEEQHYSNKGVRAEADRILNERYPGWEDAFSFDWDPFMEEPHSDIYDEVKAARLYNETHEDQVETDEDGDIINDADYNKVEEFGAELAGIWYGRGKENTVREINGIREDYTTAGLENNHEIALTVPTIKPWNIHDETHFGDAGGGRAVAWIRFGDTQITEEGSLMEYEPKSDVEREIKNYIEYAMRNGDDFETSVGYAYNQITDAPQESVGWTEEAVTAVADGMRGKEKVRKVLVIDEVQSKRHQEGREKGYIDQARLDEIERRKAEIDRQLKTIAPAVLAGDRAAKRHENLLYKEIGELRSEGYALTKDRVPDAPFDKNWHELAMKRMLRYAAENGYDVVAWTTGDQQADRYDLSRDVKKISASKPTKDGERIVNIYYRDEYNDFKNLVVDKEGKVVQGDYSGNALADVIGKEMALQIMKAEESTEFKGEGLKIGGEGMRGFYDKMLPAFMNKYGKKWGVKVEDIDLPRFGKSGLTMHSIPVTEEMKASVMEGQVMFSAVKPHQSSLAEVTDLFYKWNKDEEVVPIFERVREICEQFDTDFRFISGKEMRRIAGFAMFGVSWGNKVRYNVNAFRFLSDQQNAATLLHEMIHVATVYLMETKETHLLTEDQLQARADIKAILKEVRDTFPYEYAAIDESELIAEMANPAFRNKMKEGNLWERFVNAIRRLFGLEEMSYDRLTPTMDVLNRILETPDTWLKGVMLPKGEDYLRFSAVTITPEVREEMDRIAANAIIDGNYMLAPNGQPTKLNADQWALVRTQNFLDWFGDWINDPKNASKVVDENGEPMVMYHGTSNEPFTEFKREKIGTATDIGYSGKGFYFSSSKVNASSYLRYSGNDLMQVFLNIRNPYVVSMTDKDLNKEVTPFIGKQFFIGCKTIEEAREKYDGLLKEYLSIKDAEANINVKAIKSYLNEETIAELQQYDGTMFNWEGHPEFQETVATSPNQIKSAVETTGEFSESGDIRFSAEEAKGLLKRMQANAETLTPRELTKEIWESEIEGRVFVTPVGDVRFGENQYNKNIGKGRAREFGMLIPTIERPDLIFEETDYDTNAERQTKYVFVKTFVDESGEKHINYASISVKKDGMEVITSSHRLRDKQVLNKIEKEQMLWNRFASDSTSSAQGGSTDQSSALYESKGTNNFDSASESEEKVVADSNEADGTRFSVRTNPAPVKTQDVYKLMRLGADGKLYPLFIGSAEAIELGVWYDADSPNLGDLTRLATSVHLVNNETGEAMSVEQFKAQHPEIAFKGKKPNVDAINWATANGMRWIEIEDKAEGQKRYGGEARSYFNLGINGSGQVGQFAMRPGWHAGSLPTMRQIGKGTDKYLRDDSFVWVKGRVPADIDYQAEADANPDKDIPTHIPVDGYYMKATNANAAASQADRVGWYVAGSFIADEIISDEEARRVITEWNENHKDAQVKYDFRREGGMDFVPGVGMVETTLAPAKRAEDVVAEGLSLTDQEFARLAGEIFAALPKTWRKGLTDKVGNILDMPKATMQTVTRLAEKEDWSAREKELAKDIRNILMDIIDPSGIGLNRPLTSKEALWMMYNMLEKETDIISEAKRSMVAHNLGFDARSEAIKKKANDHISYSVVTNDKIDQSTELYNYEANLVMNRLREAWVDQHQSVIALQNALAEASGKPIESWEDVVLALNQLSSKSYADKKRYKRDFLNPLWDKVREITEKTKYKTEAIERYMMLKHALERNVLFAKRDAKEYWSNLYGKVDNLMKTQSHAQLVVALAEANKKLQDIQNQIIAGVTGLQQALINAQTEKEIVELALRGDEKQNEADLKAKFDDIDNQLDAKYWEFRKKDYSGLTSMFVDFDRSKVKKRSEYKTEEAYQAAVRAATTPRFQNVDEMEDHAKTEVHWFEQDADTLADELWNLVNAATKETLRHQHEHGTITTEQYDSVRDMFKYYVPLRGFAENTAEDMYSYYMDSSTGSGFAMPILAAKGRKTKAESPLGWIGAMAESAIQMDNKNDVKMKLYYMFLERPNTGVLSIAETWYEWDGTTDANGKKVFRPAYPPATGKVLNAQDLKQHLDQWESNMKAKQSRGEAFKGSQKLSLKGSVVFQEPAQEQEHIVRVKVAGKDYTILLNGNPRAAQAINGLLNPDATGGPFKDAWRWLRRNMSSLLTSSSPLFWVANYQRDMLSSAQRVSESDGVKAALKYLNNRRKAWRVASYIYKYENGTMGNSYYENLYKEFAENGGITGYTVLTSNKEYEKLLEDYAKHADQKVRNWLKNAYGNFMQFGEAIEQVSRFAAYITARESGKSIEESVSAAKEVSVNFNRKGSAQAISWEESGKLRKKNGKPLNDAERVVAMAISAMPAGMKELYFFFNASIQALDSSIQLAKKSPGKAIGWAGFYFGLSTAIAMINYMLTEDDDDDYLDLPDHLKRTNILVPMGEGYYLKWSVPQEMRPFYAWADIMVSKAMGKTPHKNVALEVLGTLPQWLPVNPFEAEDAVLGLVPDVASPIAESLMNRTSFGGKIYEDYKFKSEAEAKNIPAYRKATSKTGQVYVDIAEVLNSFSGGDEVQKGWANINPAVVEHLVEGYFGGIYDFSKMLLSLPMEIASDEPLQLKEIPFVNKVVMSVDETNMYSHTNEAYHYYREVAEEAARVENEYRKLGKVAEADAYKQEDDWRINMLFKQYDPELTELNKRLKDAVDDEEIKLIREEQNAIREMLLNDIANGVQPGRDVVIKEELKPIRKEVSELLKPSREANKQRLKAIKKDDIDALYKSIEKLDSLKLLPEYQRGEAMRKIINEIDKEFEELKELPEGPQRDSVIGIIEASYNALLEKAKEQL